LLVILVICVTISRLRLLSLFLIAILFCLLIVGARRLLFHLIILNDTHTHTNTHTHTDDRPPLDEGSAGRRNLCLTTHNTYNRQTSIPPAVFEPAISTTERQQTHASNRTATGIGCLHGHGKKKIEDSEILHGDIRQ